MNEFLKFYRFGAHTKYRMALYSMAVLFLKAFFDFFCGKTTTDNWTIIQVVCVCLVIALVEAVLFPENKDLEKSSLTIRTVLWVIVINVSLIGSALSFDWFSKYPLWFYIILICMLEISLFFMWVLIHIADKLDSKVLNEGLKKYQK